MTSGEISQLFQDPWIIVHGSLWFHIEVCFNKRLPHLKSCESAHNQRFLLSIMCRSRGHKTCMKTSGQEVSVKPARIQRQYIQGVGSKISSAWLLRVHYLPSRMVFRSDSVQGLHLLFACPAVCSCTFPPVLWGFCLFTVWRDLRVK